MSALYSVSSRTPHHLRPCLLRRLRFLVCFDEAVAISEQASAYTNGARDDAPSSEGLCQPSLVLGRSVKQKEPTRAVRRAAVDHTRRTTALVHELHRHHWTREGALPCSHRHHHCYCRLLPAPATPRSHTLSRRHSSCGSSSYT